MSPRWWRPRRRDPSPPPEVQMTEEAWRAKLGPARYRVLRRSATEPPWSGELLHVEGDGVFTCAGCGAPLFTAEASFDSGTGWPSFDRPAAPGAVGERRDWGLGLVRTEITCARCAGHLGHVFADGPTETGRRYCVNSLALEFEPSSAGGGTTEKAASAED